MASRETKLLRMAMQDSPKIAATYELLVDEVGTTEAKRQVTRAVKWCFQHGGLDEVLTALVVGDKRMN